MLVVTGGGGFIGSVLTARLNAAGYDRIIIVDRFGESEKWRNIARRDFCEIVATERLMEWLERFGTEVEAVFHLGAISSTWVIDADAVIATNISTPIALWRWCARTRKRLVYASSAATYGDGTAGFDDCGDPAVLRRLRPLNLYGWSKHAFDLFAAREAAAGRAPPFWAGIKFFNVFGPNEYHKGAMMSLVAKNYPKIAAGEAVPLYKSHRPDFADGAQCRDFVYVKDCAEVMLWFLGNDPDSGLYNLGSGKARTFRELISATAAACGRAPNIDYVETPPEIRPNYQYFTEARMAKLRAAGYTAPFTPLEEAVRDYVSGYLSRPDPYL
ncbi:MAG: ADP-glyceromanno-heptose 6-epimerase [Stellaceae bacterium]